MLPLVGKLTRKKGTLNGNQLLCLKKIRITGKVDQKLRKPLKAYEASICTSGLNAKNSTFRPPGVFVFCATPKTAILFVKRT